MKTLMIGLLVLGSVSTYAQVEKKSTCELQAVEEILESKTVREKLVNLLSDGDFFTVAEIQDSALTTAKLVCK